MTARQDSLFAPADLPPRKGSAVAPAVQAAGLMPRPDGWRPVTDPTREHACRDCAGVATCGVGEAWYCVPHARARGFFGAPASSGEALPTRAGDARARGFFAGSRQAGGGR